MSMLAKEYRKYSDEELLSLWKHGDFKAFDTLFKRYYEPLFRYANKNLPDRMLAEELTMDVMMRVWKKSGEISTPPGFKAYILKSLKNAFLNHFRVVYPSTIPFELLPESESPSSCALADEGLQHTEMRERYLEALSELSEKKKRVFTLSREENLSYKEIAQLLNISVNTVENYMSASLSQMREKLK